MMAALALVPEQTVARERRVARLGERFSIVVLSAAGEWIASIYDERAHACYPIAQAYGDDPQAAAGNAIAELAALAHDALAAIEALP